ncbi:MAG TPA: cytochrome c peroxidase [Blastocatellia bacterium]|nr:cytochrome c peroxidase [Blastocatellia bacterium]
MLKRFVFFAFVLSAAFVIADGYMRPAMAGSDGEREASPMVRLGERIFKDDRFSTSKGDLPASCSHCHLLDEDPQGLRAYADFFNRSWMSSRAQDRRRLMLRNSPTILDAGESPRLHYDGEFGSLEELVKGTLAGRPMGWLPGEEAQAYAHARTVLLDDRGEGQAAEGAYRDQFKKVFGLDIERISADETMSLVARAVANYCRTLTTRRDSAYDRFIAANGLASGPSAGEDPKPFIRDLISKIESLERSRALKLSNDFDSAALRGLKIFFSADSGNCAACHAPPLFTDHSFHNIGISQREYDRFHGEGKFAELAIPDSAKAVRPATQFRETPVKDNPALVDLGFWNFVDLKTSTLRRAGESDDSFLRRMIGAFKTPTLRNLRHTHPYFHDGSIHTLEGVLKEMIALSEMARASRLREADQELARVKITESDIPPLVAFLNSLSEDLKHLRNRRR